MADEVFTWVDPDGVEVPLSDPVAGYETLWGILGRFMAPVQIDEDRVPMQSGSRVRAVRLLERDVDLPVRVEGADSIQLRSRVRALLDAIDPLLGDGRLRVQLPDGQVRELVCRYQGGFEGEETGEMLGPTWQRVVLSFRASDPWWQAPNAQVITLTLDETTPTFFPFFPLKLTSSAIFAVATATNAGNTDAWPVWTISGPGSSIVLRNLTTSEVLEAAVTLGAGDKLTIDTRPGFKTVIDSAGANRFSDLSDASVLWAVAPKANVVQVEMAAATSASLVLLSFVEKYRSV